MWGGGHRGSMTTINVSNVSGAEKLPTQPAVWREVSALSSQAAESWAQEFPSCRNTGENERKGGGGKTFYFTLPRTPLARCVLKLNNTQKGDALARRATSSQPRYLFEKSDATKLSRHQLSFFPLATQKKHNPSAFKYYVTARGNGVSAEWRLKKILIPLSSRRLRWRRERTLHTQRAALFVPPASSSLLCGCLHGSCVSGRRWLAEQVRIIGRWLE